MIKDSIKIVDKQGGRDEKVFVALSVLERLLHHGCGGQGRTAEDKHPKDFFVDKLQRLEDAWK